MAQAPPSYALLWSPIPLITWIWPFIGHFGVSSSTGKAVDFAGPYCVHEDEAGGMIFGYPTRYLKLDPLKAGMMTGGRGPGAKAEEGEHPAPHTALDPASVARWWDSQLAITISAFQKQSYNILGNNCHALAAWFLNQIEYRKSRDWDMIKLAAFMFILGRHTSWAAILWTWGPFVVIAGLGGYFGRLYFLYVWIGLTAPLVIWFVVYVYCLSGANRQCGMAATP